MSDKLTDKFILLCCLEIHQHWHQQTQVQDISNRKPRLEEVASDHGSGWHSKILRAMMIYYYIIGEERRMRAKSIHLQNLGR